MTNTEEKDSNPAPPESSVEDTSKISAKEEPVEKDLKKDEPERGRSLSRSRSSHYSSRSRSYSSSYTRSSFYSSRSRSYYSSRSRSRSYDSRSFSSRSSWSRSRSRSRSRSPHIVKRRARSPSPRRRPYGRPPVGRYNRYRSRSRSFSPRGGRRHRSYSRSRSRSPPNYKRRPAPPPPPVHAVLLKNVSLNVTSDHIQEILSYFSKVLRVYMGRSYSNDARDDIQEFVVELASEGECKDVVEGMHGGLVDGNTIQVEMMARKNFDDFMKWYKVSLPKSGGPGFMGTRGKFSEYRGAPDRGFRGPPAGRGRFSGPIRHNGPGRPRSPGYRDRAPPRWDGRYNDARDAKRNPRFMDRRRPRSISRSRSRSPPRRR